MQSFNNTSPLLNHAMKIRAKNVELQKQISQLQNEIQAIENDMSSLTHTYDDLVEQCQILREKQTDKKKDVLVEEYQQQFNSYIQDIQNYLNGKQWNSSPIEKVTVSARKSSPSSESINKTDVLPVHTLNDDLNQQLASVENWLMESAVTDLEKQSSNLPETSRIDDGTDDLYKDLIFPTLSEELPTPSEDIPFDENNHREEYVMKTISPENSQQSRPDKNQRRFALMRQLAEKSNKTVTRKLI